MSFWLERVCKYKGIFGTLEEQVSCEKPRTGQEATWVLTHESASFASDTLTVLPVLMDRGGDPE